MSQLGFARVLRVALPIVACCIALPALGDDIYFSVDGQIQGKIAGEVIQKSLEGKMRALSFSFGIRTPRDPTDGMATGVRVHDLVRVTREPGRGSAQLMHALVTTEVLKEVRFDFYGPRMVNGVRTMALYHSVRLTNATLFNMERTAEPATDLSGGAVRSLEKLEFFFQKIELIDHERNVSAQDVVLVQ